ncbi:hypothetical protein BVG16_18895 [Paenibacillus selenitireducens]|uniref:AraC-type arabinose-binding/dimerisation domain-containing protein n=1 Tax=Paenibacillus selenitireducens TaxID=1324314 RepID=A0A1T2X8S4_9BACL|nr:AraC family ligand binding domain-containing protein [Paenibacillus selenitireducens]OPA76264.1 hypothetical protein BVG16_18895 [Paenibacillus selenitireducens]
MKLFNLESHLHEKDKYMAPLTAFEKTKVVQIQLTAGNGIPDHMANADLLIVVQKGIVVFEVAGERVELTPSQMLYMEPKEQHSLQAVDDVELLLIRVER